MTVKVFLVEAAVVGRKQYIWKAYYYEKKTHKWTSLLPLWMFVVSWETKKKKRLVTFPSVPFPGIEDEWNNYVATE
jgi:hypothetical protein